MTLVAEEFEKYITKYYPEGISERQKTTMRQAYLYGCMITLAMLRDASFSGSLEDGVERLNDFHQDTLRELRACSPRTE